MNDLLELSFAEITVLQPNIAEIVIANGVSVTSEMVKEYHRLLKQNLKKPSGLLINKCNSYTYSFGAQIELGLANHIKATAILVHRDSSVLIMQSIKEMPDHAQWNMDIFFEREPAVAWLDKQLTS